MSDPRFSCGFGGVASMRFRIKSRFWSSSGVPLSFNVDPISRPSLLSHTAVAQEIGFLIIYCANLDGWVLPALSAILGGEEPVAKAILEPVDNISAKLGILCNVAATRPDSPMTLAIAKPMGAATKAVSFRNSITHGHFGHPEEDLTAIALVSGFMTKRRGKPKRLILTPETVREHVDAIRDLIKAISECYGDKWMVLPAPSSPDKSSQSNRRANKRHQGQ